MRPTLTVVGKDAAPEQDELLSETCRIAARLVDVVKAGGRYWLLLDDEALNVSFVGDALEMMALAEECARDTKRAILGLA